MGEVEGTEAVRERGWGRGTASMDDADCDSMTQCLMLECTGTVSTSRTVLKGTQKETSRLSLPA